MPMRARPKARRAEPDIPARDKQPQDQERVAAWVERSGDRIRCSLLLRDAPIYPELHMAFARSPKTDAKGRTPHHKARQLVEPSYAVAENQIPAWHRVVRFRSRSRLRLRSRSRVRSRLRYRFWVLAAPTVRCSWT